MGGCQLRARNSVVRKSLGMFGGSQRGETSLEAGKMETHMIIVAARTHLGTVWLPEETQGHSQPCAGWSCRKEMSTEQAAPTASRAGRGRSRTPGPEESEGGELLL